MNALAIRSTDFWVKVVDMLQQNWAVIETADGEAVRICFLNDAGGLFDEMAFPSAEAAAEALRDNDFRHLAEETDLPSFLRPPSPPFRTARHPNGRIYSSGRYWQA